MVTKYDAIVAGHICLDITPSFHNKGDESIQDLMKPGKLINVNGASLHTGGAVSNTGLALQKLGISTLLMGKTGQDLLGDIVVKILSKHGDQPYMIRDPHSDTSYSIVIAPKGIDRIFLHHPGANDTFCSTDVPMGALQEARLLHFGYPTLMKKMFENDGKELVNFFKVMKQNQLTTSLDLSLPDPSSPSGKTDWGKILKNTLPFVDIFVPSLEEILFMLDKKAYSDLRKKAGEQDPMQVFDLQLLPHLGSQLIDMGCKIVMIKCGVKGCFLKTSTADKISDMSRATPSEPIRWSNQEIFAPSYKIPSVVSTTGCGDSAIAAFLASFLKGRTALQSLQNACAAGALTATVIDSLSALLPLNELETKIQQGWEMNK